MPETEQDRIKRQLNYYLAKNIDSLKSKFYGEDGIWSKYHAFTERFVIEDDEEIHCRTVFSEDNSNKEVSSDKEANTGSTEDVLSLETYCLGLNHTDPSHSDKNNFGAFSWWIEFYLKDLGAVGGSSSAVHGIYYSPKSKCTETQRIRIYLKKKVLTCQKKSTLMTWLKSVLQKRLIIV